MKASLSGGKRASMRLKKDDQVVVIAGKDKGKQGKILKTFPDKGKVLVENVNMVKRHTKPSQTQEGGIVEKEAPLHLSNVMIVDPATGKRTRIGKKTLENNKKVRVARGSGEIIDS